MITEVDPSMQGATFSRPLGPAAEDRLFFTASHPSFGSEPWVTNGTASGTAVIDVFAGEFNSSPSRIVYRNGYWFFLGRSASGKTELLRSDGTSEGTVVITDLTAENLNAPFFMGVVSNRYIFSGTKAADGSNSMYAIDLTNGAYTELLNISAVSGIKSVYAIVGSTLFFCAVDDGVDLWKTDGTPEGTIKVADRNYITQMAAAGGVLYFVDQPVRSGPEMELYRSDGTLEGTVMVKDINGSASGAPENLFAFNQKLVFTAIDATAGKEVWITDGTEENTTLLKDIFAGGKRSVTSPWFRVVDNELYFAANDGVHGTELWKSDGTPAGTELVKDINAGDESSMPVEMIENAGELLFSAYTPDTGYELWTSDGTADGTELYLDMVPGPQSSNPRNFVMLGDKILFIAFTESTGTQAWSYTEPVTAIFDKEQKGLNVFPNPSSGVFRVDGEKIVGQSLAIYNSQGHLVSTLQNVSDNLEINLSHFSPGLYLLKFNDGRKTEVVKVVKW
jgi:ELWxxDGT repeat protein